LTAKYTYKQGQYLAFIYFYTKLHKRPPAELDLQQYFQVTPPSVHQMIVALEARGLISRIPWTPRSIQILVAKDKLYPTWIEID
jgi:repressor LexA